MRLTTVLLASLASLVSSLGLAGCSGGDGGSVLPLADAASSDASPDALPSDAGPEASTTPAPIDPIDIGYEWTYDVTILGSYPLCAPGKQVGKVLGPMSYEGKTGFRLQSLCPYAGISDYAVSGDRVEVRVLEAGAWELALDVPVAAGKTWTNSYGTFEWQPIPDEMVSGIARGNCFRAKDTKGASYTNYCRGVGPTHWHIEDASGNGYDAVLTGVNF